MKPDQRGSRTLLSAVLLSTAGGWLDAYTYHTRGGVFANAQTGNIIKAGLAASELQMTECIRYLIPVLAFTCGVILSLSVEDWFEKHYRAYPRRAVLCIEMILLAIISFIPATPSGNMLANTLVSFLCAMQMQTFRFLRSRSVATTVAMGNLRSASEYLYKGVTEKDRESMKTSAAYFVIILFFVIGIIIGALVTKSAGIRSTLYAELLLGADIIHISSVYAKHSDHS